MRAWTIPGGQTAYAGDEEAVRAQVEEAMSEAKPLPTWSYSVKPGLPMAIERCERMALTQRTLVDAWAYNSDHWICSLNSHLPSIDGPRLTAADRLAIFREALTEIDAVRPVLVRLIQSAEAALEPVATGVIDSETS